MESPIVNTEVRRRTPAITLEFHPKATMPQRLEHQASALGITPAQLIHRFISDAMRDPSLAKAPGNTGMSMTDVLVRNGALNA